GDPGQSIIAQSSAPTTDGTYGVWIDSDDGKVYQLDSGSWAFSGFTLASSVNWTGIGGTINDFTAKTTPVDADLAVIADSAASFVTKKLTFANLWTWTQNKIKA